MNFSRIVGFKVGLESIMEARFVTLDCIQVTSHLMWSPLPCRAYDLFSCKGNFFSSSE